MKSVVIADDDEATRGLVSAALSRAGYQVHAAEDGDEAWALLTLHRPDGETTLLYLSPDLQVGNYTVLNFSVDDIDATVDALSERGVEFLRYDGAPQDEKGIARGMGPAIAWFTDPDGNVLAVLETP